MGEPTRQLLLKPKELAERWGISERAALDIIKRTPGRVVIGLGERVVYRLPVAVADRLESVSDERAFPKHGLNRAGREAILRRLLKQQKWRCAVCQRKFAPPLTPHVDHCHRTGVVRGALCGDCNHGLGCFADNPAALRAAADYVERWRVSHKEPGNG